MKVVKVTPQDLFPNPDYTKPELGKNGVNFKKQAWRKQLHPKSYLVSDENVYFENMKKYEFKAGKYKKCVVPNFEHY